MTNEERFSLNGLAALRDFWKKHPDAEIPLRSWYTLASRSDWRRPADVKAGYRNAGVVSNSFRANPDKSLARLIRFLGKKTTS